MPHVPVVLGSAALVIAEHGRLRLDRVGRRLVAAHIWTAEMTATGMALADTPSRRESTSQIHDGTCSTAGHRSWTAQAVGCTWSSAASWRISAAG